jgi:carbamoyltransferase
LILGIGGVENDAACAVVRDGMLRAAVEEEKLRHQFHPGSLPEQAIAACLKAVKATPEDVDCVAIARPFGHGLHEALRARFPQARIVLVEHHAAHASSAFYLSGFEEATVLTLDREGDSRCGALWKARGAELRLEHEAIYPDSLGELYSRVTAKLGLEPDADEHKVQWMSAAGQPLYKQFFLDLFSSGASNWMRLDLRQLHALEGQPADIAASLQQAVEEWVLALAPPGGDLCLAGGLFFNVMLVAALENSGRWNRVFVQPAAGNSGTALGAACYAWHRTMGRSEPIAFNGLDLGPEFAAEEIKRVVENCKLRFHLLNTSDEVIQRAVTLLGEHGILAWMQGRMEFGPRALGNRSILASPLDPYSSENLNEYIKHRDRYRKFAASVPAERAAEFFEVGANARFLATVGTVKPAYRETFASALLDSSRIRVHTVHREDNPLYHRLLVVAGEASGLPVLYNTSFNLFGDPLVCTPRDAVRSFYSSGIDAMFVGNFLLEK